MGEPSSLYFINVQWPLLLLFFFSSYIKVLYSFQLKVFEKLSATHMQLYQQKATAFTYSYIN